MVLGAAIGVYALYTIYQAFAAGESKVAGLLSAPFNSLSSLGSSITNFFSNLLSSLWSSITNFFSNLGTGTASSSVPAITPLTPAQAATPGGAFVASSVTDPNSVVPVSSSPTIPTVFNTLPDGSAINYSTTTAS